MTNSSGASRACGPRCALRAKPSQIGAAVEFSQKLSLPGKKAICLSYEKPEDIFSGTARGPPAGAISTITGLSYALLDERGPPAVAVPENARKEKSGSTRTGVFRPHPGARASSRRPTGRSRRRWMRVPAGSSTGRLRDQWHTMSRTGTIAGLFAHEPEPRVTMASGGSFAAQINDGDLVQVCPARSHYLQAAADPDLNARSRVHSDALGRNGFWGARAGAGSTSSPSPPSTPLRANPSSQHCAVRVGARSFRGAWSPSAIRRRRFFSGEPARAAHGRRRRMPCARSSARDSPERAFAIAAEKAPQETDPGEIDASRLDAPKPPATTTASTHRARILLEGNTGGGAPLRRYRSNPG